MLGDGIIPLRGYVSVVITAIAVLKGMARLVRDTARVEMQLRNNPVSLHTEIRLAKPVYRH
jgi:hypothetical protein